ncbi:hypothetical protein AVEN_61852-1 [Araneus ventricosus]|uniref:Uncharacterized protein n=1 Tax=Araneus ventricosus TaxID=182803 RepID=A0A4Y2KWB7_ARAVE|nr:hypothetical protein AVEN_61852-1 [Araneus ventricosus]
MAGTAIASSTDAVVLVAHYRTTARPLLKEVCIITGGRIKSPTIAITLGDVRCDNRRVDKGTVITPPPSCVLQKTFASVSLVSDKTANIFLKKSDIAIPLMDQSFPITLHPMNWGREDILKMHGPIPAYCPTASRKTPGTRYAGGGRYGNGIFHCILGVKERAVFHLTQKELSKV